VSAVIIIVHGFLRIPEDLLYAYGMFLTFGQISVVERQKTLNFKMCEFFKIMFDCRV